MAENLYSTEEVRKQLGFKTRRRVQQACERYGLGRKVGKSFVLTDDDVEWLRNRKGKRGRRHWLTTEG
jgi:hypothetical protein